jgi:hypothetical protein
VDEVPCFFSYKTVAAAWLSFFKRIQVIRTKKKVQTKAEKKKQA